MSQASIECSDYAIDLDFSCEGTDRYFYKLVSSSSWIIRRVQSVELIDDKRMVRKESLDVDMNVVLELANTHQLPGGRSELAIPIALMPRGPRDFSVVDEKGHPLSVVQSDQCADAWIGTLVYSLKRLPVTTEFYRWSQTHGRNRVLTAVREDVRRLIRPVDEISAMGVTHTMLAAPECHSLRVLLWRHLSKNGTIENGDVWEAIGTTRWDAWAVLWRVDEFVQLLKCALQKSIMSVIVERPFRRRVIKYDFYDYITPDISIRSVLDAHQADALERVYRNNETPCIQMSGRESANLLRSHIARMPKTAGSILWLLFLHVMRSMTLFPLRITEKMTVVGTREHLRIGCPDGIRLAGYSVTDRDKVESQSNGFRVIFYARSAGALNIVDRGTTTVYLRPRLSGFWWPALLVLSIASALNYMSLQMDSDPSIPGFVNLMLLTSSLSSLYVARPGEHLYRARMLAAPRFAVALGGISSGVVATVAVFYKDRVQLVSGWAFHACLALLAYFALVSVSGWLQHECSRVLSNRIIWWSDNNTLRQHWCSVYRGRLGDIIEFFRLLWSVGIVPVLSLIRRSASRAINATLSLMWHWLCLLYGLYDFHYGTLNRVTSRPNIAQRGGRRS